MDIKTKNIINRVTRGAKIALIASIPSIAVPFAGYNLYVASSQVLTANEGDGFIQSRDIMTDLSSEIPTAIIGVNASDMRNQPLYFLAPQAAMANAALDRLSSISNKNFIGDSRIRGTMARGALGIEKDTIGRGSAAGLDITKEGDRSYVMIFDHIARDGSIKLSRSITGQDVDKIPDKESLNDFVLAHETGHAGSIGLVSMQRIKRDSIIGNPSAPEAFFESVADSYATFTIVKRAGKNQEDLTSALDTAQDCADFRMLSFYQNMKDAAETKTKIDLGHYTVPTLDAAVASMKIKEVRDEAIKLSPRGLNILSHIFAEKFGSSSRMDLDGFAKIGSAVPVSDNISLHSQAATVKGIDASVATLSDHINASGETQLSAIPERAAKRIALAWNSVIKTKIAAPELPRTGFADKVPSSFYKSLIAEANALDKTFSVIADKGINNPITRPQITGIIKKCVDSSGNQLKDFSSLNSYVNGERIDDRKVSGEIKIACTRNPEAYLSGGWRNLLVASAINMHDVRDKEKNQIRSGNKIMAER